MLFTELETERLVLKNISSNDRDFVFQQFSSNFINRYLFDTEPLTDISGADEIIAYYTTPEPRHQHRWILVHKQDSMKIGTCGLHGWNQGEAIAEIGYDLIEQYCGHGYMHEAISAMTEFAKSKMKVKNLTACISEMNDKSIALVQRNGFILTGDKNETFRNKEYLHHIYTLAIT